MLSRPMKNIKTDFFASPHPHHPEFALARTLAWQPSWDRDLADDHLFPRPASPRPSPPLSQHPLYSPQALSCLSPFSEEAEEQEDSYIIHQKLEFSEEVLSPMTPPRVPREDLDPTTTIKKPSPYVQGELIQTPASNKPSYQRGLKNLANEAFKYVVHQRRSSYKEVAMSLVLQREDQHTIHRKGEMNIKRRVYDALNVLIAVGLLKRKGNRITANRQAVPSSTEIDEDSSGRRQFLEMQRNRLRSECWEQGQRLAQKQDQLERLKRQLEAYKHIISLNSQKKQGGVKKIDLPCIALCSEKAPLPGQDLTLNQTLGAIQVRYKGESLTVVSQLDLLAHVNQGQSQRKKFRSR